MNLVIRLNFVCFLLLSVQQIQASNFCGTDIVAAQSEKSSERYEMIHRYMFNASDTLIVDNFSTAMITMIQMKWSVNSVPSFDLIEIQRRNIPDTTWNQLTILPNPLTSFLDTTLLRTHAYQYRCRVHTQNGWEPYFSSVPVVVEDPCVIDILRYILPVKDYSIQYRLFHENHHSPASIFDTVDVVIKFLGTIDTSSLERVHLIREIALKEGLAHDTNIVRITEQKDSTHTLSFSKCIFWGRYWQSCWFVRWSDTIRISLASRFNRVSQSFAQTPPLKLSFIIGSIEDTGHVTLERDFGVWYDVFLKGFGYGYENFSSTLESVTSVQNKIGEEKNWSMSNYPNPFSSSTTIRFNVVTRQAMTLRIYDILGREVATLINDDMDAGGHSIQFDAKKFNLPSGMYVYELSNGVNRLRKKMLVLQ